MMDHNEFDFIVDLIRPFKDFLKRLSVSQSKGQDELLLETQLLNNERGIKIVCSDVDDS
jgi:hypothetical protein